MTRRLWTATVAGIAVTLIVPSAPATVRAALNYTPKPHPGSLHELATILATNARMALAAQLAARHTPARRAMATLIGANAALTGAAAAAYGPAAVPFLIHVPLEWWAFGRALQRRAIPLTVALLVAAATLECYATPQQAHDITAAPHVTARTYAHHNGERRQSRAHRGRLPASPSPAPPASPATRSAASTPRASCTTSARSASLTPSCSSRAG